MIRADSLIQTKSKPIPFHSIPNSQAQFSNTRPPIRHQIQTIQPPNLHMPHLLQRHALNSPPHLRPPGTILQKRLKILSKLPRLPPITNPPQLLGPSLEKRAAHLCFDERVAGKRALPALVVENAQGVEFWQERREQAERRVFACGESDAELR